jgi:hypothetical protein
MTAAIYARVSTVDQDPENQLQELHTASVHRRRRSRGEFTAAVCAIGFPVVRACPTLRLTIRPFAHKMNESAARAISILRSRRADSTPPVHRDGRCPRAKIRRPYNRGANRQIFNATASF